MISRNDPDTGIRVFDSIERHGLDISRGAFTDGRDAYPYLKPFSCNLFLSANPSDVVKGLRAGVPAALVMPPPDGPVPGDDGEVRIAFDGDAVLFDEESERIFQEQGLDAFLENEERLADIPMSPGPFEPFLRALQRVQSEFPADRSPIRVALVTARNAPAHKRVVNTLRAWAVRVDEAFFLGGVDKGPILAALKPHIFFDDQVSHLESAQATTPSAQVPSIAMQATLFGDASSLEGTPTALVTIPTHTVAAPPVGTPSRRGRGADTDSIVESAGELPPTPGRGGADPAVRSVADSRVGGSDDDQSRDA